MLKCTVKFCGGCNPRYERSEAYREILDKTADIAHFSLPDESEEYDILLIIRGCTGCEYLYEDINAKYRLICKDKQDISGIISEIRTLSQHKKKV